MSSKLISKPIITISIIESDLGKLKMTSTETDGVNLAVQYVLILSNDLVLRDNLIL